LEQRGIDHKRVLYNNQHAGDDGEKWVEGAGGKLSRERNLWIPFAMILPIMASNTTINHKSTIGDVGVGTDSVEI
jgi:hypothetical protein